MNTTKKFSLAEAAAQVYYDYHLTRWPLIRITTNDRDDEAVIQVAGITSKQALLFLPQSEIIGVSKAAFKIKYRQITLLIPMTG